MAGLLRALVLGLALLASGLAGASIPRGYSDDELAQFPDVVIAYWPGGAARPRQVSSYGSSQQGSERTIVVTKVLGGSIRPGRVRVMSADWIDWSGGRDLGMSDGPRKFGVEDIHRPNVWFLKSGGGGQPYLIESFFCVQPLNLAPLFQALRPADRNVRVGSCLTSSDPEVVSRALKFVDGNRDPWPVENVFPKPDWGDEPRPLANQMGRVRDVVLGRLSYCRANATAIYARGAGRASVGVLRRLLDDREPEVQWMAAAWLVRLHDTRAVPKIGAVLSRIANPDIACEIAVAAQRSRDSAYVPALIPLLDNHMHWATIDDEAYVPSVFAQRALRSLVGVGFPPDAASSSRAWRLASVERSSAARARKLKAILGNWDDPLEATYRQVSGSGQIMPGLSGQMVEVTVRNRTDHAIVMGNRPLSIVWNWAYGGFSGGFAGPGSDRPIRLVSVGPGGRLRFRMLVDGSIFRRGLGPAIGLHFLDGVQRFGRSHWTGIVNARDAGR